MSTSKKGVIAIFSRPLVGFDNIAGLKRVVRHLWVAFISCNPREGVETGKQMTVEDFENAMPGNKVPIKNGEGIDLQNTNPKLFGYWRKVIVKAHHNVGISKRLMFYNTMISTVRLHKLKGAGAVNKHDYQTVLPIYTGQDALAKWKKIAQAAEGYAYSESQWDYATENNAPASRIKKWPKSQYQIVGNNSTTFIKTIVKPVYKKRISFKGFTHPGRGSAKKPVSNLRNTKIVRADERMDHRPNN